VIHGAAIGGAVLTALLTAAPAVPAVKAGCSPRFRDPDVTRKTLRPARTGGPVGSRGLLVTFTFWCRDHHAHTYPIHFKVERRNAQGTAWVLLPGRFTVTARAIETERSVNHFFFTGRLGGRTLAPGRYRLDAQFSFGYHTPGFKILSPGG
jgi:hypothetical protein